jgi:hypothetical protein
MILTLLSRFWARIDERMYRDWLAAQSFQELNSPWTGNKANKKLWEMACITS